MSSFQTTSWAWTQQIVRRPKTRFVLIALANSSGTHGLVSASLPYLAQLTGMSQAAVQRRITELVELDILSADGAMMGTLLYRIKAGVIE